MRPLRAGLPLSLVALLAACGGGSSPRPSPPTPTPSAGWQAPQRLGDGGPGSASARGGHLGLAADADGSATAVWDALAADGSSRPWAARKPAGAAWSGAEALAEAGAWPVVSGGREAIVVWQVARVEAGGIWERSSYHGQWEPAVQLGGDVTASGAQVVGANSSGSAAWVSGEVPGAFVTQFDPVAASTPVRVGNARSERQVRLNGPLALLDSERGLEWSRRVSRGWELQETLSPAYESGAYLDLTRGAPVDWALWDERGTIVASRLGSRGAGPLVPLFALSPGFASAAVASSPAGSIACLATVDARLQCAWALGAADFAPPDPLPVQAPGATWIDVALDPQGAAAVAWASPSGLFAVRAAGPGRWGQGQRIDRGEGGRPVEVRLRADGSGRLLAVWTGSPDGRAAGVWASELAP